MPGDFEEEVTIKGQHGTDLKIVAVDADGQIYSLMVGRDGNIVAVDEDGNMQTLMYGSYSGVLKAVAVDADGKLMARLYGTFGDNPIPIAVDSGGALKFMSYSQALISADDAEAQTWDGTLTSLLNNLNRIRYALVHLSGETWGTFTTSTAALLAKFHATTGHKHTAATGDGPQLDHGQLGGLSDNDHTQYELVTDITALFHATTGHKHTAVAGDGPQLDHGLLGGLSDDDHTIYDLSSGARARTDYPISRAVDNDRINLIGGTNVAGHGARIVVRGCDHATYPGSLAFYVPNAAKTGDLEILRVLGDTDAPYLNFISRLLSSVKDPVSAQDAATKNYVDTADALKLPLAGGTMSGAIAMGTSKITGMGDPASAQDAATKNYVDGKFPAWAAWTAGKNWSTATPAISLEEYRYTRIDQIVFFHLYLSGNDGNGATNLTISTPIAVSHAFSYWILQTAEIYVGSTRYTPSCWIQGASDLIQFTGFPTLTNDVAYSIVVTGFYAPA